MFNLHHFLCHPSDTALKSILDQGLLSRHTHLTSADVDLMRSFYGSCLACTIGKLSNQDLHITSDSSPSTHIGQKVFFDLQLLTTTSLGRNTQALDICLSSVPSLRTITMSWNVLKNSSPPTTPVATSLPVSVPTLKQFVLP